MWESNKEELSEEAQVHNIEESAKVVSNGCILFLHTIVL